MRIRPWPHMLLLRAFLGADRAGYTEQHGPIMVNQELQGLR